jgi:hypothetical protein
MVSCIITQRTIWLNSHRAADSFCRLCSMWWQARMTTTRAHSRCSQSACIRRVVGLGGRGHTWRYGAMRNSYCVLQYLTCKPLRGVLYTSSNKHLAVACCWLQALKGHGAVCRLVILPHESHS